jgi:hypothetical protein
MHINFHAHTNKSMAHVSKAMHVHFQAHPNKSMHVNVQAHVSKAMHINFQAHVSKAMLVNFQAHPNKSMHVNFHAHVSKSMRVNIHAHIKKYAHSFAGMRDLGKTRTSVRATWKSSASSPWTNWTLTSLRYLSPVLQTKLCS